MNFDRKDYKWFLESKTSDKWEKIGIQRRAGVLAPLFSLYSKNSTGIGEIPDLKLLVDWCVKTNQSIIQLLPLNDTGFKYTPYDCESTFALDPVYLCPTEIKGVDILPFKKFVEKIKNNFPAGKKRVDYGVKKEKLKLFAAMFESVDSFPEEYEDFAELNSFWIREYAVFKILKEKNGQKAWEAWEEKYKLREGGAIENFCEENFDEVNFYIWLQYQLFVQMKKVREYAEEKGVFIQGDLPFLVSRDSADVWANQNYFKLNLSSGAPPDMYFAKGQRWGMPPYNWENIEEHNYDYLREKIKLAENFYHMFRIDHFVGLFRLWTIKMSEPKETYGLNGKYDPDGEEQWKKHGQKILDIMLDSSSMLPCAEDLGTVPECSFETLDEYALPGMDVQRWTRDWDGGCAFLPVDKYRPNSVCLISSHDMTPLILWWEKEAGTVDEMLVEKYCAEKGLDKKEVKSKLFDMASSEGGRLRWKKDVDSPDKVLKTLGLDRDDAWMFYDMNKETYPEKKQFLEFAGIKEAPGATKEFIKSALNKAAEAKSIFSIQQIQDWLSLGSYFDEWDKWDMRVNYPGTISNKNWTLAMPLSLEALLDAEINHVIKSINNSAGRV